MVYVDFDKQLYSKQAINDSIEAFEEVAEFGFQEEEDFYKVSIRTSGENSPEFIRDEFNNYVLALMKNEGI